MPIGSVLLRLAFALLTGGAALLANPAQAACSAVAGAVNLGSVTSFAVASTAQGASGSTGFSCTGSGVLTLITTNMVTATISSASNSLGTQPRLHDATTGDYIPYVICKDSACGTTYAVGSQINWSATTLLGLLGLFNSTGGTLPIYIRTAPGTQVAAGTYTSMIGVAWAWSICDLGAVNLCLFRSTGNTTSTITVTMIVTRDCAITAPPLDFGSAAFVGSFDPVTQSITIRCSKGAAYTVGIDNGQHFSTNRRMINGANAIAYEIYYPSSSLTRWGNGAGQRVSSSAATTNGGTYTGTTDQTYQYKAQILSGQSTPPAGTYLDTLIVDIQF